MFIRSFRAWQLVSGVALIVVSLGLLGQPTVVYGVTLQELFDGDTITADDKLFRDWTLIDVLSVNGGFANAGLVDVTPLVDDPLNPGIKFTSSVDGIGTPFGHTGPSSVVLTFSFNVLTTNGLPLIKDNSLRINDWVFDSSQEASITISENVFDTAGQALGDKLVTALPGEIPPDLGNPSHFDTATFAPQSFLHVVKRINVQGPGDNDGARVLMFEQRFSQVPEPSGIVPLIFGACVLATRRLRRRVANT